MRSFKPKLPSIPSGTDKGQASKAAKRFVPAAQTAVNDQIKAITAMPTASNYAATTRKLEAHPQRAADHVTKTTSHQMKRVQKTGPSPSTGTGGTSSGDTSGGSSTGGTGSGGGSTDPATELTTQLRDKILQAVQHAVQTFMAQAYFDDVSITAIAATGPAGCLHGPELDAYITSAPSVAGLGGTAGQIRDGVAEGVSESFDSWRSKVTIPGLPWYPAFAAWPGPEAPPTPNVPCPLLTLASAHMSKIIMPNELQSSITDSLPSGLAGSSAVTAFCQNIAASLAASFSAWLAGTQVQLVMGHGPVPTFAPPYVPVGPVVNGSVIAAPGPLASGTFTIVALPMSP